LSPLETSASLCSLGSEVHSRIATVVCAALTSDMLWAEAPGNVVLDTKLIGLPKDSVANVSRAVTLDRSALIERAGILAAKKLELVPSGIEVVLGR
jgi:mRNA interferase MazF